MDHPMTNFNDGQKFHISKIIHQDSQLSWVIDLWLISDTY